VGIFVALHMKQVLCSILCSLVGVLDKDPSVDTSSISRQKTFSFTSHLEAAVLFVHLDTCVNQHLCDLGPVTWGGAFL
jgi:hypothetical protein